MEQERRHPTLGVGVFVVGHFGATAKILIGRRGNACKRGAGCYALPGGHVDVGETLQQAAVREVREETRVLCDIGGIAPPFAEPGLLATTDHGRDGIEHITFWMLCTFVTGHANVTEPEKCDWWAWMTLEEIAAAVGATGHDRTHPQYHWTPLPLWDAILKPYLGDPCRSNLQT